ncbi:MAG: DUF5667 domain-containing protein [Patescibacteria group bacterium]
MNNKALIKELQSLKEINKPSTLWRDQTRQRVLQLAEQKPLSVWSNSDRWLERWFEFRRHLAPVPVVASLVVVVMIILGSVPLAKGLAASLPGDWLYPAKRLEERVQISLKQTPVSQAVYSLELASRRLGELQQVPIGDAVQSELLRAYNIRLSFAQAYYQASEPSLSLAQLYDQGTKQLESKLNNIVVANSDTRIYRNAGRLTRQINSEALTTLVALHQGGDNGDRHQVVTDRLQQEIDEVEQKFATIQTKINKLPAVQQRESKVVIDSKRQVVTASKASEEVSKTLAEAKELLEKKEFSLALEKLKEGEVISLKTEEVISEITGENEEEAGEVEGVEKIEEIEGVEETTVKQEIPVEENKDSSESVGGVGTKLQIIE